VVAGTSFFIAPVLLTNGSFVLEAIFRPSMKTLLLLPGALGDSTQFGPLKALLNNDFEVICPDYPGHGQQAFLETPLCIPALSEWLLGVLKNQTHPVAVFGYSLGGYLALYTALQHPQKFDSILTLATKFDWKPEQAAAEAKFLQLETLQAKSAAFLQKLESAHGKIAVPQLLKETAQLMLALGDKPLLNSTNLSNISIPVAIGVGDRDRMVGLDESYKAFKALPNGQFYVLPSTKHPFESVNLAQLHFQILSFFAPKG
jgi:pimeloyl-ACP methyl ester carboxylesterase